ncbi:MAG TPA: alpha/beta fold hydrolase [Candidatus Limnocylindrales bacterium]
MIWSWGTRRAGVAAAVAALPVVLAYRFAQVYRVRAGFPRPAPPNWTPDAVGMPYETVAIPTAGGVSLPGWFMPGDRARAPAIVLVHGWESARDRALPHAQFLRAAGFHTLAIDVRGHGENAPEALPISVGEFADDAVAAARWLAGRKEVTSVGMLGHSMGAAGALVAAAAEPRIEAVVGISTPADPDRLTRQTFRLAELPIPGPVAWPLAWVTTRVYLRPRRRTVASISAAQAVRAIEAPVLLVHGDEDRAIPVGHLARLAAGRRAARPAAVTRTLVVHEGHHSWLHEFPIFRATVARFFAEALDGPLPPDVATAAAEAVDAVRLPEPERVTMIDEQPGGFRSLLLVFRRQRPRTESADIAAQEDRT